MERFPLETPRQMQVFLWGFVLESLMSTRFFLETDELTADAVLRSADARIRSFVETVTGIPQPCEQNGNLHARHGCH